MRPCAIESKTAAKQLGSPMHVTLKANGGPCDGTDSCDGAGNCVDGYAPATTICPAG
jgi:hypothetical protein